MAEDDDDSRERIANSSGEPSDRRGREREHARRESHQSERGADRQPSIGEDRQHASGMDHQPSPEAQSRTSDAGQPTAGDPAGGDGSVEDGRFDDLSSRIDSLAETVEHNGARLRSMRADQTALTEDVAEIHGVLGRLVDVYEDTVQPVDFGTDANEEATEYRTSNEETAEYRTPNEETTSSDYGRSDPDNWEFESGVGDPGPDESDRRSATADGRPPQPTSDTGVDRADGSRRITLDGLADSYATDVLVFEWLTELVRTGGASATLRAISYYHEIGWIDAAVREHLEAVLSGPDLDIHVDPQRTPEELTADDHATSYEYISKLAAVSKAVGAVNT